MEGRGGKHQLGSAGTREIGVNRFEVRSQKWERSTLSTTIVVLMILLYSLGGFAIPSTSKESSTTTSL